MSRPAAPPAPPDPSGARFRAVLAASRPTGGTDEFLSPKPSAGDNVRQRKFAFSFEEYKTEADKITALLDEIRDLRERARKDYTAAMDAGDLSMLETVKQTAALRRSKQSELKRLVKPEFWEQYDVDEDLDLFVSASSHSS